MNSNLEFRRSIFGPDLYLSWNKTDEKTAALKNILNVFEIKKIEDISNHFDVDTTEYEKVSKKVLKIMNSFSSFGKNISIENAIPKFILEEFVDSRNKILENCSKELEKYISEDFVKFYTSEIFSVPKRLNKTIMTTEGEEILNFVFSKNFRLKSASGLNIFHLPKKERIKIIPQKDDHILYSCDFKQFEFRTFLNLHPSLTVPRCENLYDFFSEKLNMSKENCKVSIISYLYGSNNKILDDFFQKDKIDINSAVFSYDKMFVLLDEKQDDKKKFHSVIQSISQFFILEKILNLQNLLKNYDSMILFSLHDELLFSINKDEIKDLLPQIREIIIDEIYKIHESIGLNYFEMRKIK